MSERLFQSSEVSAWLAAKDRQIASMTKSHDLLADELRDTQLRLAAARVQLKAALDVCRMEVDEYEDTFISPDEMTGQAHLIYKAAKSALKTGLPVLYAR